MFGAPGPYDSEPACIGSGAMGGFSFNSREAVAAFHAKALELGVEPQDQPTIQGSGGSARGAPATGGRGLKPKTRRAGS